MTDVDPDSPAGDNHFRPGDVIVEVQSEAVHTPDEVAKRLEADAKAGKKIEMLLVSRAGESTYVAHAAQRRGVVRQFTGRTLLRDDLFVPISLQI